MQRSDVHAIRRKRALYACASLAAFAGAFVGAQDGDKSATPQTPPTLCEQNGDAALARMAGQRVMVRMEARATRRLMRQARSGAIGGVILFPPPDVSGERLAAAIDAMQRAARAGGNPPLLVAIDQEGGIVERLPALPPQLSPFTLAQINRPASARLEGRATGFQLTEIGINVNLAPVLDVPSSAGQFMAPRAFGSTPDKVARLALAFAQGQRNEALASTAKHFPGLGRAIENTDFAPTTIDAPRSALMADIQPFTAAVDAGIELVMLSSASYPRLGGDGMPAVLSPTIVTELLRVQLGFTGVTISDDLLAPAIALVGSRARTVVRAAAAGTDILLFAARAPEGVAGVLARALAAGALTEEAMRGSCARILDLKAAFAAGAASP